jgi:hypothetical protein
MNRKERRAAKFKAPRPTLRELATSLCLAAPWCVRSRWPRHYAPCVEMSFAGREVLRRHQYGAEMASCLLMIRNAQTNLCIGNYRAGYDLLMRRGQFRQLPPFEDWRSKMRFEGETDGRHVVVKAHDGRSRAFLDLTFGQIALRTKGAIQVPPAFAGFGNVEWPSAEIEGVSFSYFEAPELPELGEMKVSDWHGLIDDLVTLVEIAQDCRNDARKFEVVMEEQMRSIGR